jgi:hypothetical protein
MNMLFIDGVKYKLWKPRDEKQFEEVVKKHSSLIFGENSLYFDIKPELRSKTGIGSKPDGIVMVLDKPAFYIVENERAEHGVHDHVVTQISRFNAAFKKPETKTKIVETLYTYIMNDPFKLTFVQSKIKGELHKFLTDMIFSRPPTVVIIIDKLLPELEDAVGDLPFESKTVQFQTYVREDAENVRAHLFEPIYAEAETQETTIGKPSDKGEKPLSTIGEAKTGSVLEIEQRTESERKYAYFHLPKSNRRFFPGYKVDFILETDIGDIKTRVTSAKGETQRGDLDAGATVQGGLKQWYNKHPEVTLGRKLRFECIEPYKRYELVVV